MSDIGKFGGSLGYSGVLIQLEDEEKADRAPAKREITLAARATIELFGNSAIAKTRERLSEVEAEGNEQSIEYWQQLLEEVERLHRRRH